MKSVVHKAESRGHANHGWLNSHHTFSFAGYHNPDRMNFGVLRVLNDDSVTAGMGFGTHPHNNMEIVSIPLEGALEHKDSMNNVSVIRKGDIQLMSAGTGVSHSEKNESNAEDVKFLQIWIIPNKQNVEPRYDQIKLELPANKLQQVLSPNQDDAGVWIHQNAWFHMGEFTERTEISYDLKNSENGVYVFILEGNATVAGNELSKRDGLGIWELETFALTMEASSKVLIMEVPLGF